ncbi:MAG: vanadium-dependent haloperoxidase, partial [Bacteroidota bacterium]
PLEWDLKTYFVLGGAMHDAAVTAWSIKGWYDYIRPISAIRYMCSLGQSSDPSLPSYHPAGIPLQEGYIELIQEGDPLAGAINENIDRIKLMAWRGHDQIQDPSRDVAGVGWILGQDWFPYQRPSFVTPPFAGYLSGHSTFSRAAAEVLTLVTGDAFFPGGMGEFVAKKDEFLVFEKGPSVDIKLQWATYRDASDQTSLSRIWGGIHPPADDILGRLIGAKVGTEAYHFALPYFDGDSPIIDPSLSPVIYPNPNTTAQVVIKNVLET